MITSELLLTSTLTASDIRRIYDLFSCYFVGTTPAVFDADLAAKNWVLLLRDSATQTLVGFSGLWVYDVNFGGEILTIVYSGDTIVAPSDWSRSPLAKSWIAAVNQIRAQHAGQRCFWLLISSGFRTYRFLPTFWQTFYPCYDRPTPPRRQTLLDFLAQRQFQHHYDAIAGIVRLPQPQQLCPELRGIPPQRLRDPHIRFFAQRNPGYERGDELVCLTEISPANLTAAGRRMWFGSHLVSEELSR